YLGSLVMTIDRMPKMEFTKTKDESQDAPAFKVTLGVIPDYLFDGQGMRIDGVREDRPASNAGLLKGDVVTKMGNVDIVDMQTYMKALSVFEPGETITITVVRDGDMVMEKQLTFLKTKK
ncbi:PDZ domain-containing protein, partial [bacterium]|nr:PDZ domain-containing protein [bacterium]